jgi:hypothetical protein
MLNFSDKNEEFSTEIAMQIFRTKENLLLDP